MSAFKNIGFLFLGFIIAQTILGFAIPELSNPEPYELKIWLSVSQILSYLLPAGLILYFSKDEIFSKFNTNQIFNKKLIIGIGIILISFPFLQLAYALNLMIPISENLIAIEEEATKMMQILFSENHFLAVLTNLLLVGLLAGLGEELFFRGVLQKNLVQYTNKPHLSIWIAAIVFSFLHFQFQGFIPRLLVGALLGYLYYYSDSIWVAVAGHFFFNGFQVLVASFIGIDQLDNISEQTVTITSTLVGIASLIATVYSVYWLTNRYNLKNQDFKAI